MTFLLDVNVLIALIDPAHVSHDAAHAWFEREGQRSWATCPLTENGVLRIIGNPKYPNTPGSPAVVADVVRELRRATGHEFWGDTISLFDENYSDVSQVLTSAQVTDTYLLSLAAAQGGKLVTFDRRLSARATKAGKDTLQVITG